jgi:hypothetical protein
LAEYGVVPSRSSAFASEVAYHNVDGSHKTASLADLLAIIAASLGNYVVSESMPYGRSHQWLQLPLLLPPSSQRMPSHH